MFSKTAYLLLLFFLFSIIIVFAQAESKKGSISAKNNIGEIETKNKSLNFICFNIDASNITRQIKGTDLNFPITIGLGGNILLQHIFSGSDLAVYLQAGFAQWRSNGEIIYLGDTIPKGEIKDKLTAIPILAGLKFYKKYFYGFIEGGMYLTKLEKTTNYSGNDSAFHIANDATISKTCFSFSPGIGYEIKITKKSFVDLNIRYQHLFYGDPSLNLIGFRVGYDLYIN